MESKTEIWIHHKITLVLIVITIGLIITGGIAGLVMKDVIPMLICWGVAIPFALYIKFYEARH